MYHDDDGHCRVTTNDGYEHTSSDDFDGANSKQIKQISVNVQMDMIDFQSFEIWGAAVYSQHVEKVGKGYFYGYHAITHTLSGISRLELGGDIQYDSIVRKPPGYRDEISVADFIHVVISLLEVDNSQKDNHPAEATSPIDHFRRVYNALDPNV